LSYALVVVSVVLLLQWLFEKSADIAFSASENAIFDGFEKLGKKAGK